MASTNHLADDPLDLPITGRTASRIRRWALGDPPATPSVEEIVRGDPALAFHALRVANSPFFGLPGKVSTLSHAFALLGRDSLQGLVIGAALRKVDEKGLLVVPADPQRFWIHSWHVAEVARRLADRAGYDLPEEAWVTGLLHDTGTRLPGPAPALGVAARAGALARRCRLPRALAAAIHHHPSPPGRIARLAARTRALASLTAAADWLVVRDTGGEPRPHGPDHLAALEVSERTADEVLAEAETALLDTLRFEGHELASLEEAYRFASERSAEAVEPERFGNGAARSFMRRIRETLDEARERDNGTEIVEAVVTLLERDLGYDRALYLERGRGSRSLRLAHASESTCFERDGDEVKLTLGNGERTLTRVLKQRESAVARDSARDPALLGFFGVAQMALAPVVVGRRVVGVLAVDQFLRGLALTDRDLDTLEVLAAKTGLLLENRELGHRERRLRRIAERDDLTGIFNRRYCIDLCRKEIERARRYAAPLSVVVIDIDNFKTINDTFGHPAGDRVLRDLARMIQTNSRGTDIIGRFGGDEFLVLLPQISRQQAITYAERVRSRVADLGRSLRKQFPRLSLAVSLGVATFHKGDRMEEVLAAADKALYAAKDRGRNRVCTTE